jgi:hypothetical protein
MNPRHKTLLVVVVVMASLSGGCLETITSEQLQGFGGQVQALNDKVDGYQAATAKAVDDLAAFGIVSNGLIEDVAKANTEIDRVQPQVAEIAKAVAEADYVNAEGVLSIIEAAQVGVGATGAWNPYAIPIYGVLGVLSTILGWIAKRKAAEADVNAAKYNSMKIGVNKTLINDPGSGSSQLLYANIGEARTALGVT